MPAIVICTMECKHRSRRPLRSWKYKDGRKCYGCKLKAVSIQRIFDLDGDIQATAGEENMARCANYEPITEKGRGEEATI